MNIRKGEEHIKPGIMLAPYVTIVEATVINGEIVWYRNKWKNLLLKIKHLFFKPKYLKHKWMSKYAENPVNPNFYSALTIKPENEEKKD